MTTRAAIAPARPGSSAGSPAGSPAATRPSAAKRAQMPAARSGSKPAAVVTSIPSPASTTRASEAGVPRSRAAASGAISIPTRPCVGARCDEPVAGALESDVAPEVVAPAEHERRRDRGVGRVLERPLERADGQARARVVAGEDRAELLLGDAERAAGHARTRTRPAGRAPGRCPRRPAGPGPSRAAAGVVRSTVADAPRPSSTQRAKPSTATGSKRCSPTRRCQRAKSPRWVRPMLPAPIPPMGTPAHGPSSIIGVSTRARGTGSQPAPIGWDQAWAGIRMATPTSPRRRRRCPA